MMLDSCVNSKSERNCSLVNVLFVSKIILPTKLELLSVLGSAMWMLSLSVTQGNK